MKEALWYPSEERKAHANMTRYIDFLKDRYGLDFKNYDELYTWSINKRADFWATLWDFFDIKASLYETVLENPDNMLESKWFQGARLNFAEHLMRFRKGTALIFKGENQKPVTITNKLAANQTVYVGVSTDPFTVQGGNGSYTWTVRKDGNLVDIASGGSYVFNATGDGATGEYSITATDGNSFTDSFYVNVIYDTSQSSNKSIEDTSPDTSSVSDESIENPNQVFFSDDISWK